MRRLCFFLLLPCLALANGPPEDRVRLADGLYARGLHDLALAEYQTLLEAYPVFEGRATMLFRAGESARALNRPERATAFFREAVAVGGASPAAQRARLRLLDQTFRAREFAAARRQARELLDLSPEPILAASALHTLGAASLRLEDTTTAREAFSRLVQNYPDDLFAAYAALSLARMEAPGSEARREWYRAVLRNPPNPEMAVEGLWGLARLESDLGNPAEAANLFKRLWEEHRDSTRVRQGALHIAWAFFQAERHAEALAVANQIPAERKRDHLDTWLYLEAVSLRVAGDKNAAISRYQRMMEETPGSRFRATAAFDLALLLSQRGEHEKVLPLARDLMTLPDRRADALWLLAESARLAGKHEDALNWYLAVARMEDEPERAADARWQRAMLTRQTNRPAAAEVFRDFARRHPSDPRAPSALRAAGSLFLERGERDTAITLWTEALTKQPDAEEAPELEFQTALLLMAREDTREAIRRFRSVAERDPPARRRGEAAYWLGILLAQTGASGAETALRLALEHDLSPEQSIRARFRLGSLLRNDGDEAAAFEAFRPVLSSPDTSEVPDSLLVWMNVHARQHAEPDTRRAVAEAMVAPNRRPETRELGNYALAALASEQGKHAEAARFWRDGIAFQSETPESVEARLHLGDALLETGETAAAAVVFGDASRLASRLNQENLHARSLLALGRVHALMEAWEDSARFYLGMAVLYDDPELTPGALHAAALAFEKAGRPGDAASAREELRRRHPAAAIRLLAEETP